MFLMASTPPLFSFPESFVVMIPPGGVPFAYEVHPRNEIRVSHSISSIIAHMPDGPEGSPRH